MSKESRRRQRQAGQVPASGPPSKRPASGGPAAPAPRSGGPGGLERAGRRDRARPLARPSAFQRYRTVILAAAVLAVLALVGAGLFSAATEKAYACTTVWQPAPTPSPRDGASPQPGYVQPDMGGGHVPTGSKITYTYCPPASGRHYQQPAAPIAARVYGPDDAVIPQQWVHNLEHGGLVILYKGAEVDEAALRALFDAIPPSPVCGFQPGGQSPGPLVARFDDMAWPFAAIVWGRELPLQTLDHQAILDFYQTFGERTNPEDLCPGARESASPSASAAPSSPSAPSAAPSAVPSTAPSAAPSGSAGPTTSPTAAPS